MKEMDAEGVFSEEQLRLIRSILREDKFERLDSYLELLASCCRDEDFEGPLEGLLLTIMESVIYLVRDGREKGQWPTWKMFKMLDKRRPSLRLVQRINGLVKRTIDRRKEKCGESALEKAARQPDSPETLILLRNFAEQKRKFVDAFKDHNHRLRQRVKSESLLIWLSVIEHPEAQNLILPDIEPMSDVGYFTRRRNLDKVSWKRSKNRERQERFRQRNFLRQKSVTKRPR